MSIPPSVSAARTLVRRVIRASLLLTLAAGGGAAAATEGGSAAGTVVAETIVSARSALGRPVAHLAPADFELREEGRAMEVLSVTPVLSPTEGEEGTPAAPWRLLVYVDTPLLTARSRYRTADALAERAAELTRLGPVAVVVAGRAPQAPATQLRLRPSRDPKLVAGVLAAVAREGGGGDLARLRARRLALVRRAAGAPSTGERSSPGEPVDLEALRRSLLATAEREGALLEERIQRLREALAGLGGGGPGLLLWLGDGFDLDFLPFYLESAAAERGLTGEEREALAALLADDLRRHDPSTLVEALAPDLAAAGWTALPLAFRARLDAGSVADATGEGLPGLFADPLEPLEALARETAGLVVPDARVLSPALADLAGRWRVRYLRPPGAVPPAPRIELVSRRDGLRLAAPALARRRDDAASRAGQRALALFGPGAAAGSLGLDCRLLGAAAAGGGAEVRLRCSLAAGEAGGGRWSGKETVWVAVLARSGRPSPETLAHFRLPADPRAAGRRRLPLQVDLRLPPGARELAIGVAADPGPGSAAGRPAGAWGATRLAMPAAGGTVAETGEAGTAGPDAAAAAHSDAPVAAVAEDLGWLPAGAAPIYLVPPPGTVVTGRTRVAVQVVRPGVARVDFQLDGRTVVSDGEAPFEAWLALPEIPAPHRLRAVARDREGRAMGEDSLLLNRPEARFAVRISEPRQLPGPGEYDVRLEVEVPPRGRLRRLELFWNDERLAAFAEPPYRARLRLPPGTSSGYLRAAAALDDGATAEDVVAFGRESFSAHVEVELVELFPVVRDRRGRPVADLARDEIILLEEGAPRDLQHFARGSDEPLTVGLVLDVSGSVDDDLPLIQEAARRFLRQVMRPGDRAFLVAFADRPFLLLPPTGDLGALEAMIGRLEAGGGTSLYDTAAFSLLQLSGVAGRKAVVLLTDGDDTASRLGYDSCLAFARRSGVPLYLVGLGSLAGPLGFPRRVGLTRLARSTGADLHLVGRVEGLTRTYAAIAEELRSQYLLTFSPEPGTAGWRRLELRVDRPGVEVRAASGYHAGVPEG